MRLSELRKYIKVVILKEQPQSPSSSSRRFAPPIGQRPAIISPQQKFKNELDEAEKLLEKFVMSVPGTKNDFEARSQSPGQRHAMGDIKYFVENGEKKLVGIILEDVVMLPNTPFKDRQSVFITGNSIDTDEYYNLKASELIEILKRAGTGFGALEEFVKMVRKRGVPHAP